MEIRIDLTRTNCNAKISKNITRISIIHFRTFLYQETCFLRVTISLLCRLQAQSMIHVRIYPYLICQHHNGPPTQYKINLNHCRSIDLVIRIGITPAILMPRFPNFLNIDHPFSHVFIFCSMFTESHGCVAVPVTMSNNFVSLHKLDRDKLEHACIID